MRRTGPPTIASQEVGEGGQLSPSSQAPIQSFEGPKKTNWAGVQVSGGYQAPDFHTKALQHSRVQLTWDANEQTRARGLSRRLNADQLREDDFKVQCPDMTFYCYYLLVFALCPSACLVVHE